MFQYERRSRIIFHIVEIETMHKLKCQLCEISLRLFSAYQYFIQPERFLIHDLFNQTPIHY